MTRVSDPIIAMRVHVLRMPTLATHAHGIGDVSSFDTVILELKTSSGITGWGEASPWPVFTGTVEASVAALHVFMRPYLMGADPCLVEKHLAAMDRMVVNCTEAKAAVEMALLDIMGKMSGLSVGDLIGGRCHDAIPLSFSVANPNYDLDRETVKEFYARNIRIYKLKAGFASHEFDVMRLQDLRNTYGSEIDLRVDYNQGMHAYEAIRRLKDLERFDLTFIEQPVPRTNIEAMARITQAIDTPILADESVFGPRDALTVVKM
ncbi:muconate cycloisomerase [Komagataeibacter xylinus NBRC 15237]|nr:muconate cycloisomerase [Komagataeibacter xylinus NBRC 15237]